MDDSYVAFQYPILDDDVAYYDSMSPHPSRLLLLGGDFDGDRMSNNIVLTEEANQEARDYLSKAKAYVNPRGGLLASPIVNTVERVLFNFTGD